MQIFDSVYLSFDTDWAPDFVIEQQIQRLIDANVPATWFITHDAPWIQYLRDHPSLFEVGIHPNFLPNSSHGSTVSAVLKHCVALAPEARSMRTHGLMQSTHILDYVVEETPIEVDVSILMHRASVAPPHWHIGHAKHLLRLPFIWEDDIEARSYNPSWEVLPKRPSTDPYILNFHPILLALNDGDGHAYASLRSECPDIRKATASQIAKYRQSGPGPADMFELLLRQVKENMHAERICDLLKNVQVSS